MSQSARTKKLTPTIPVLDLADGREMLNEFIAEALKHLLTAKNSLLVLETVTDDRESIDTIFKSFHTIKGLADFLNLQDIKLLTQEAETMLNMIRKNLLQFDSKISALTSQSIDGLHKLIELLNEQVTNGGHLDSPYYNIGELMNALETVNASTHSENPARPVEFERDIPSISIELPGTPVKKHPAMTLPKDLDQSKYSQFITQLEDARKELERAQGKLAERQREAIKERELAIKLTQQAQATARAKSEYLATMAHEIRTLINAILGFADLVKRGALDVKQKDHLETIVLSGNLLLGIVNDILDFSKVEAGKLKFESIDFNLGHIVEDVFKIIRTRLGGKQVNLFFEIAPDVPYGLIGDPTRLKQIFINLLDNAIKFTEKGEIGLVISSQTSSPPSTAPGKTLRFTVQDTGIGIPESRKSRVFESFAQAEISTTRIYGGSGLGLALCKNYVEGMGGQIWVESVVGKGSKFIFTIHFGEDKMPAGFHIKIPDGVTARRIFILDSYEKSRQSMQGMAQKLGLQVVGTSPGVSQAIDFLVAAKRTKTNMPEILLVDTMLPDKGGVVFAQKIRQDADLKTIKIIATSTDLKNDAEDKLTQEGFDDFLPKPFIAGEFVNVLERVFGLKSKETRPSMQDKLQNVSCAGIKVLVVEDSLPNQELLKVHFETLGCVADYATNGQEAIEKVKKKDYDICFMDLQMPVMGGIEASRIIRQDLKKNVPIIALTAAAQDEERQNCRQAGMIDYLAKPFNFLQLKEIVIRSTKI